MNKKTLIGRRRFLKQVGCAVGAAAFPAIIPASALGRGGAIAPSERITMGFIGVGGQGTGHLLGGAWTYVPGGYTGRKEVQVLAVCDVWRNRRESATQRVNAHTPRFMARTITNHVKPTMIFATSSRVRILMPC